MDAECVEDGHPAADLAGHAGAVLPLLCCHSIQLAGEPLTCPGVPCGAVGLWERGPGVNGLEQG